VLWKLAGSGHVWPGGVREQCKRLLGKSTDVIDSNEVMWEFFARFSLP
jgi:poly(3-hydroxybutyrate) depolymerase